MSARFNQVGALIVTAALTACGDGLIYSERTSINLASARLNDDPATPVSIKLGFDRDVVAVAPRIRGEPTESSAAGTDAADGTSSNPAIDQPSTTRAAAATTGCDEGAPSGATPGGEAVSQFSTFSVNVGTPFVPVINNVAATDDQRQMWVHSRFASGGAALAIACAPDVAAAIMGLAGNPVTADMVTPEATQRRAAIFQAIAATDDSTARRLAVTPPTPMDQAMQNVVSAVDPDNRRGTNAGRARQVLRAWVPELPVSSYAAWESALGI